MSSQFLLFCQVLLVDAQRLQVVVLPVSPDTADVSVLPLEQTMKKDDSIHKVIYILEYNII